MENHSGPWGNLCTFRLFFRWRAFYMVQKYRNFRILTMGWNKRLCCIGCRSSGSCACSLFSNSGNFLWRTLWIQIRVYLPFAYLEGVFCDRGQICRPGTARFLWGPFSGRNELSAAILDPLGLVYGVFLERFSWNWRRRGHSGQNGTWFARRPILSL